jgi:hypothetical protein
LCNYGMKFGDVEMRDEFLDECTIKH